MMRLLPLAAALVLLAGPAMAGGLIDGGAGGFTQITPSDWVRRYLSERVTTENMPPSGSEIVQPSDPKPGDLCVVGSTRVLFCNVTFKCRAYVGLNPNTHEEFWEPRREGNDFVCDEGDRPSVKAKVQL